MANLVTRVYAFGVWTALGTTPAVPTLHHTITKMSAPTSREEKGESAAQTQDSQTTQIKTKAQQVHFFEYTELKLFFCFFCKIMLRICGLGTNKCCLYIVFLCTGAPFTDYMNNACIHYLHKVRDIELSQKI